MNDKRVATFLHFRARSLALILIVLAPAFVLAAGPDQALFMGVSLETPDATVPPGGTLQLQVMVTEPKPIKKGRQNILIGSPTLGAVNGAALFSPSGDVSGVAVLGNNGPRVTFSSPLSSFGEGPDYPVMVFTMPVQSDAQIGQAVPLTLDAGTAAWYDPNGQLYPLETKSGVMTVGGALSVSDVQPGFGMVQAGATITIRGIGFDPDAVVSVNNAVIASSQWVNSGEIRITLTTSINIEATRIRVTNKSTNERVEFYPFARTTPLGRSKHQLIAASYPLFSHDTWTTAFFKPIVQGTVFTGLAVQNLTSSSARVRLDLYSSQGKLLATMAGLLPNNKRATRDLQEIFPGLVSTGTTLRVRSNVAIQMLGLQGDDATGEVLPIEPSPNP